MMEGEKNGFIMTAGTSGDTYNLDMEDVGLVPGHAYTILGVKEIKVGGTIERLVHIRNPWGNGEWSGDWSDESEKWTPALKRMANMGKEQDDGEFFMSYKDFIKYYVVLGICKLYDENGKKHFNYPLESEYMAEELKNLHDNGTTKIQIHGGGMGCAFIKTDVFRRIEYPWYYWVNYKHRGVLSEELYFCEECRKNSIPIYTDTRVNCGHMLRHIQYAD